METIRGSVSHDLDWNSFKERLTSYHRLVLDLGTGDGRFVRTLAGMNPGWFIVGLDACRENLHKHSRVELANMLFVIASAQEIPGEFNGLFSYLTINFPWGSLLEGLVAGESALMNGLAEVTRPGTQIEIRLNGGALAETGTSLKAGTAAIDENLHRHGWRINPPCLLDPRVLRRFPSTWARRLAHGRDPRAVLLTGTRAGF